MELVDALVALLAPLAFGDELVPGVRLVRASTELGLRLTFDDGGRTVHVEVFPAEPPRPHAARSSALAFAYRVAREGPPLDPARGQALCRAVAERARTNEARVLAALRTDDGAGPIREVRGGPLLEPAGTDARPYFTLSPYVGCLIGCRFCYAQERVAVARALRGLAERPWGSYVDVRVDAPERLDEELAHVPSRPIKLCPIVSDPYHAIEARLGLTRRCLEVLAAHPPRMVLVLTRARLVERDADVFASMPEARVGMSVPTVDDAIARWFEPRAASIAERLAVLSSLRARGIRTFAVVQPLLPGDVHALADALACTVDSVSVDVLRGEEDAGSLFDAHPEARDARWQDERAHALTEALRSRRVSVWQGELPPV
jgi:DNA repair photolyase